MKKKKKNSLKKKTQKFQKRSIKTLKNRKKRQANKKPRSKKKRKKIIKKTKRKFRNKIKKPKIKTKKSNQRTRAIVSGFLKLNDKLKSLVRFNFDLDQSLQNFFNGISNKVSLIKKVIIEEREKQKLLKIKQPNPIFKITICFTRYSQNVKILSIVWNTLEKVRKKKTNNPCSILYYV